jgi:hypothetical protein
MAISETTLASACGLNDTVIVVAASTGLAAGVQLVIDQEVFLVTNNYTVANQGVNVPVLRAQDGGVTQAHPSGANVYHALPSDQEWGSFAPQTVTGYPIAGRANTLISYSAAGAIAHPAAGNNAIAIINGTNALAMTLADPNRSLDGSILYIQGNGAAAHTVTIAGGVGGGGSSYDVFTFAAGAKNGIALIAVNQTWNILSSVLAGNTTNITATIA